MFIVFGRKTTTTVMGLLQSPCPRCRQQTWHNYSRARSWFTLFFIPCLPLGTKTWSRCVACGGSQLLAKAEVERVLAQRLLPERSVTAQ
jgi:hypothetical protein